MSNKAEEKESKPFSGFDVLNMDPNKSVFSDDSSMEFTEEETPIEAKKPADLTDDELEDSKNEELEDDSTKASKADKKEEVKKVEEEEEKTDASVYKVFAEQLSEKGLLVYDAESFEDSEEGLEAAMQNTIQTGIDQFIEELPEDFKKMLEYHNAGGDLKNFSKAFYEAIDWTTVDISNEDNQKLVTKEALIRSGETEETAEEMVAEWSDLGTLEKHAKRSQDKLGKMDAEYKNSLLVKQKQEAESRKKQAEAEWESFKTDLFSKENIKGFKINQKIKDDMWKFMTVPDKKTGLTPLQKHNKENKEAQFLYAYLAMNDWNIDKLKKEVKTEVASVLSNKLKNVTDNRNKIAGGKQSTFAKEQSNKFSAFKTALTTNV